MFIKFNYLKFVNYALKLLFKLYSNIYERMSFSRQAFKTFKPWIDIEKMGMTHAQLIIHAWKRFWKGFQILSLAYLSLPVKDITGLSNFKKSSSTYQE